MRKVIVKFGITKEQKAYIAKKAKEGEISQAEVLRSIIKGAMSK